jgi:hypothetical protein
MVALEVVRPIAKTDRIAADPSMRRSSSKMTEKTYDLQGYAIVLDKVVFLTRVFEAEEGEGYQFNIRFAGDLRLAPRFPTRHEADLQRILLLKALNS